MNYKLSKMAKLLQATVLVAGLSACGDKPQAPTFHDQPKGYVEFYMPESRPGEESIGIDTQIYQIENGQRVFLGMTRKWSGLAVPKRGLTVTATPGEHDYVIVYDSAEATARVAVKEGGYHKVRIDMTGMTHQEMIGATRQLRFGLQASVEPPQ